MNDDDYKSVAAMPDCDRDKLRVALSYLARGDYSCWPDDRDTIVTETRRLLDAHDAQADEIERLRETIKAATEAMQEEQRDLWASADMDDEHGAHVGLARHARTVAEGIGRGEVALTRAYEARFPDA